MFAIMVWAKHDRRIGVELILYNIAVMYAP